MTGLRERSPRLTVVRMTSSIPGPATPPADFAALVAEVFVWRVPALTRIVVHDMAAEGDRTSSVLAEHETMTPERSHEYLSRLFVVGERRELSSDNWAYAVRFRTFDEL